MPVKVLKLNDFRFRNKVACFDYDWTLVKPSSGGTFPEGIDDWEWLRTSVPEKLKEVYQSGFCIVIVTNQSKLWKVVQITEVLQRLELPCLAIIAMDKEDHKPNPTAFNTNLPVRKWTKRDVSFFVGDALGRPNDWSDVDRLFAEAVGFKTILPPEDFFPDVV